MLNFEIMLAKLSWVRTCKHRRGARTRIKNCECECGYIITTRIKRTEGKHNNPYHNSNTHHSTSSAILSKQSTEQYVSNTVGNAEEKTHHSNKAEELCCRRKADRLKRKTFFLRWRAEWRHYTDVVHTTNIHSTVLYSDTVHVYAVLYSRQYMYTEYYTAHSTCIRSTIQYTVHEYTVLYST